MVWLMTSWFTSRLDWPWAIPERDGEYFTGLRPRAARWLLICPSIFWASAFRVPEDTETMSEEEALAAGAVNSPPARTTAAAAVDAVSAVTARWKELCPVRTARWRGGMWRRFVFGRAGIPPRGAAGRCTLRGQLASAGADWCRSCPVSGMSGVGPETEGRPAGHGTPAGHARVRLVTCYAIVT